MVIALAVELTCACEFEPGLEMLGVSGFSSELLDADRGSPPSLELLRKPFSRDELLQAVARVVGSPQLLQGRQAPTALPDEN